MAAAAPGMCRTATERRRRRGALGAVACWGHCCTVAGRAPCAGLGTRAREQWQACMVNVPTDDVEPLTCSGGGCSRESGAPALRAQRREAGAWGCGAQTGHWAVGNARRACRVQRPSPASSTGSRAPASWLAPAAVCNCSRTVRMKFRSRRALRHLSPGAASPTQGCASSTGRGQAWGVAARAELLWPAGGGASAAGVLCPWQHAVFVRGSALCPRQPCVIGAVPGAGR
jgi:hypothetical protein